MKKLILILLACGGLSSVANAEGGTTIGSGGDALRELFSNAKGVAASKVEQMNLCSFDSSTPLAIRDWLIQNQTRLAMDIRLSQHAWVVDSQTTCGFTNHAPQSTVYLSYPTCASTANSLNNAFFVLVHESAHHLGVDDERQADAIARAVLYANIVPNCSMGNGVFDPNICSSAPMTTSDASKYFKPGDTFAFVGNYKFYGQISRCVSLSGCEPAKAWDLEAYQSSQLINYMGLKIASIETSPYFNLSFYIGSVGSRDEYKIENGVLADRGMYGYHVTFYGPSYRNVIEHIVGYSSKTKDFRVGKDCLWSKWTQTFQLEGGTTEKVDVVLYGTH
jgi:hypothetical protein